MENNNIRILLKKIENKPLILEQIFPFMLKRPYILYNLISTDSNLKKKLNDIFGNIKMKNNQLGEKYCENLLLYSHIKDIIDKIQQILESQKNKSITYKYIKNNINFSFIGYLYKSLLKKPEIKNKKYIKNDILKGIILDYYSLLNNIVLTYAPYLDFEYSLAIDEMNKKSKEKNKNKQNIKLLLIFDENCFYNCVKNNALSINIKEVEIIFGDKFIYYDNLFTKLNLYLSKIKYLNNVNKIIIHNLYYDNYLNLYDDNNKIINKDIYQCIFNYFIDNYYLNENKNEIYINILQKYIKEVILEDITFLYIYEKFKLYYFVLDIFINMNMNKNNNKLKIFVKDKIMIIIIKKENINISEIIDFINYQLTENKNNCIQYLFIVNHSKLIDDLKTSNEKYIIDTDNLKELSFINMKNEDCQKICNIISSSNKNNNKYEGYDIHNNLIFYREGTTNIQSFDLIDLFKYNKILTKLKLIKENNIINYNEERTKLEIINNNLNKNELNDIINKNIKISHFTQFLYNQKYLKEITINNFDYNFNDIENKNINILNINYDKNISTIKYEIIKNNDSHKNLIKLFPSLINLNFGGNYEWLFDLTINDMPKNITQIKIISDKKISKLNKLIKKFNKKGKELIIDYINNEDNNELNIDENENDDIEENNNDDNYDEYDYPVTNYKGHSYPGITMHQIKYGLIDYYFRESSEEEKKFINKFNEIHYKNIYLIDYSLILKEYQKNTKIKNLLNQFYYDYNYIIKFKFRASEDKDLNFKNFLNAYTNSSNQILVIKLSLDIYFVQLYKYSNYNFDYIYYYIFDYEDYIKYESFLNNKLNIKLNEKPHIEFTNYFTILNSYNSGKFINDIILKDKKIEKGTNFSILDLEIFTLNKKNKNK